MSISEEVLGKRKVKKVRSKKIGRFRITLLDACPPKRGGAIIKVLGLGLVRPDLDEEEGFSIFFMYYENAAERYRYLNTKADIKYLLEEWTGVRVPW